MNLMARELRGHNLRMAGYDVCLAADPDISSPGLPNVVRHSIYRSTPEVFELLISVEPL